MTYEPKVQPDGRMYRVIRSKGSGAIPMALSTAFISEGSAMKSIEVYEEGLANVKKLIASRKKVRTKTSHKEK